MGTWITTSCGALIDQTDRVFAIQLGLPLSGACIHDRIVTYLRNTDAMCDGTELYNMDIAPGYCYSNNAYFGATDSQDVNYKYRFAWFDFQRLMRENKAKSGPFTVQLLAAIKNGSGCTGPVNIQTVGMWSDKNFSPISVACSQTAYACNSYMTVSGCTAFPSTVLHTWTVNTDGTVTC